MQRLRLVVRCWFLTACLVPGFSFAQDDRAVRVGVTVLASASGITGAAGRDRLVKALNKQKNSAVEAVPIEAMVGAQISAEARQKNCEFVVFPTMMEAHSESQVTGRMASTGVGNIPEYHATIEYKVYRVSDSSVVASGSAKAQDIGSQGEVAEQALDRVATKAVADIKNAGATK